MSIVTTTKTCTKCGEVKLLEDFGKHKISADGLRSVCKDCRKVEGQLYAKANRKGIKAYHAKYYAANRGEWSKNGKAYYTANRDRILERTKGYRESNREKYLEDKKASYRRNREKYRKQQKAYYEANRVEITKINKAWVKENREKVTAYKRDWHNEKLATDPVFKLKLNLRKRLFMAISKGYKKGSAVRDLGCSIPALKQYLESQFNSRMTWDNWGTYWHIDHIYPLAAADLADRVQFLAACNWQNLQPITTTANLKKGDKVTPAAKRLFNKLVKQFEKEPV